MAGIDEASARSTLATMQARLARDPSSALGLPPNANVDDLRTAFLELTKQFHPVRFGRMAIDIQKLSNEVFLALRAAHDSLAKTLKRKTGPMIVPRAPASAQPATSPPQPRAAVPTVSGSSTSAVSGATARPVRPAGVNDTGERPVLQSPTPPSGSKIVPRAISSPGAGSGPVSRPLGARPGAASSSSPPASHAAPHQASHPASHPAAASATAPTAALSEPAILDLLSRHQWDQARTALHQLAARDPGSKRVRALAAYARGREAQIDGRVDDARVELQDALDLDPELSPAKTALTALFTRRK